MGNIYKIAKKANVSIATISRVLNNGPVSPSTKEKVLRIIEEEGYIPDGRAISLRKIKRDIIGVIFPDITNPVYPVSLKNIHDFMKEKGYHLIFGNTYGEVEEEKNIIEIMIRERVAGIIIGTCEGEDDKELLPIFKNIIKNGIPIIFLGRKNFSLPVDMISVDNFDGTYKITEYLIKKGREKIGFIAGNINLKTSQERFYGYKKALEDYGIGFNKEIVICDGEFNIEYGEIFTRNLIEKKVDAIVCGNDLMAIGSLNFLKEKGIKVPDDICITGFDDIYISSLITPKLTTVRQPFEKITKIACERLIGWIKKEINESRKILIKPEIILRESA